MNRRPFPFASARIVAALFLMAGAMVGTLAPAAASAASLAFTTAEKAAIDRVLTQAVERGDTPGVVALVVGRDGVLYESAIGKRDAGTGVPMTPDTIFNIASMTKPVTSVAIMMLIEQGRLTLDDPVSKHLPGFDDLQVLASFNEADGSYTTRPAKRPMTVRHLLTHTSGIAYGFTSPILTRLQEGTNKSEWEFPLLHDPGEKWTYGAGTRVLGMIVEKITGTPLETWYQQHLFGPLGMKDTSFAVPKHKQSRLASNHRKNDGAFTPQPTQPPEAPPVPSRGDGGLYSTAHDYGLFIRMFLNGGQLGPARILSPASIEIMGRNHIGPVLVQTQEIGAPALSRPFPLGAGRDTFGLGFQVTAPSADTRLYRSAGSLSWAGLYNTEFWIDPETQVGGVLLMQLLPFYDEGAIRTLQAFEAAVYRAVRRKT